MHLKYHHPYKFLGGNIMVLTVRLSVWVQYIYGLEVTHMLVISVSLRSRYHVLGVHLILCSMPRRHFKLTKFQM